MLYFLIIVKRKETQSRNVSEIELSQFVPNGNDLTYNQWATSDNNVEVHYWLPRDSYFNQAYYSDISDSNLRLFNGWINDGNPLNTPLVKRNLKGIEGKSGEYIYIDVKSNGTGSVERNLTSSVQTYYSVNEDYAIICNRASLINYILRPKAALKNCLDINFLSWSISTSWAHDESSLFKGINILSQGTRIIVQNKNVHFEKEQDDIWADRSLQELYSKHKEQYWDICYDKLIDNLNLFFNYFNEPFNFPLSGGKDSRLLLGLILNSDGKHLINKTVTNGPPYSGEVIAGRLLANHLKLRHESNEGGYHGFNMTDKLGKHIFFTEGEVSPMDLTPNFQRVSKKMVLRGQEVGLRNISNVKENNFDKIESWFFRHLGNFNHLGFLNDNYIIERQKEFKKLWLNKNLATRPTDLPTKNRIETRFLRWGGRIWTAHNTNEFTPFIFLDDSIVKSTYNASIEARMNEEFHFEMMKRCGHSLVEIPFFSQKWSEKYNIKSEAISHYKVDKKPMRGSHAVLFKNLDHVKQFILESNIVELLGDVVNWNDFMSFKQEDLKGGHYQPFWHLTQMAAISNLKNFTQEEVCNIHNEMPEFPSLKDDVENLDPLSLEKSKTGKYKEVIIDLLVNKEKNESRKGHNKLIFNLFGYEISKE